MSSLPILLTCSVTISAISANAGTESTMSATVAEPGTYPVVAVEEAAFPAMVLAGGKNCNFR